MVEYTLDPEDWGEFRALGRRTVDDMMMSLQNIRDIPFRRPTEEDINNILIPLPQQGEGEEKVYEVFQKHILPSCLLNVRPTFLGLVAGTGSPYGMLAAMLTSRTNCFF